MKKLFTICICLCLALVLFSSCKKKPVATTGFSIELEELKILVKDSTFINYTITPKNATSQTIIWRTTNPYIVSVSKNAMIRALNKGTVCITGETIDGGFKDSCFVTVVLTFEEDRDTIIWPSDGGDWCDTDYEEEEGGNGEEGGSEPGDGGNGGSGEGGGETPGGGEGGSDEGGNNPGEGGGNNEGGNEAGEGEETVNIPLQNIRFEPAEFNLPMGKSHKLNIVFIPENATNKDVVFTQTTTSMADFYNVSLDEKTGVVTGNSISMGAPSTIEARSVDGNHVATCRIYVVNQEEEVESGDKELKDIIGKTYVTEDRVGGGGGGAWYAIHIKDNGSIGIGYCSVAQQNAVNLSRGGTSTSASSGKHTLPYTYDEATKTLDLGDGFHRIIGGTIRVNGDYLTNTFLSSPTEMKDIDKIPGIK